MKTTILLTSMGEAHLLRRSLPAAQSQPDAETVVIDIGALDDSAYVARQHDARVLDFARGTHYCDVMDAAIKATGADAVLLLNADCFLEPGFLAAATPHLSEPRDGSVAPKLLRTLGPDVGDRLDAIDAAGMVI